jgi:hypothetical protein
LHSLTPALLVGNRDADNKAIRRIQSREARGIEIPGVSEAASRNRDPADHGSGCLDIDAAGFVTLDVGGNDAGGRSTEGDSAGGCIDGEFTGDGSPANLGLGLTTVIGRRHILDRPVMQRQPVGNTRHGQHRSRRQLHMVKCSVVARLLVKPNDRVGPVNVRHARSPRPRRWNIGGRGMTEAPKLLLAHHLKMLKQPTFLRE